MSDTLTTHRRWIGSLLSFLLPGSGLFLAGNRKAGWQWFFGLSSLWLVKVVVIPLPAIPNLIAYGSLSFITLALYCVLIARSYLPIPKIGITRWVALLGLALGFALVKGVIAQFFTHPFNMPTGSMIPTVQPGDHLFVQKYAYWLYPPKRGDIIVFRTDELDVPLLPKGYFHVKRIAGLPGETVEIKDGKLLVDGRLIAAPDVLTKDHFTLNTLAHSSGSSTNKASIPSGHYFIVGDNATNSFDGRYFGPIPKASICGKVTKIYWPLKRITDIR